VDGPVAAGVERERSITGDGANRRGSFVRVRAPPSVPIVGPTHGRITETLMTLMPI